MWVNFAGLYVQMVFEAQVKLSWLSDTFCQEIAGCDWYAKQMSLSPSLISKFGLSLSDKSGFVSYFKPTGKSSSSEAPT